MMTKAPTILAQAAIALTVCLAGARAATVQQSTPFSIDESYANAAAIGTPTPANLYIIKPGSFFTTTVTPFDTSLGTLTSITITWDLSGSFVATTGATGGGATVTFGGTYYVNDIGIGGGGGGGGTGGGPQTQVSAVFPDASGSHTYSTTLTSASAAWAPLSGGTTPVSMNWDSPLAFSDTASATDIAVVATGSATVTYTYTPVPEVSTALLAGAPLLAMAAFGRRRNGSRL